LDAKLAEGGRLGTTAPLVGFVRVMETYTHTAMDEIAGEGAEIDPRLADAIVSDSSLLRWMASLEPAVTVPPLRRDRQLWTETGPFGSTAARHPAAPNPADFVGPEAAPSQPSAAKPFGFGLYTSTATSNGTSMWQLYLEPYAGSNLYPLPWYTWELMSKAGSAVAEIASATDWVQFLEAFGRLEHGYLVPDWRKAAERYAGVHYTLRAIAAAQGFHFRTERGIIPAAFWDVECTFWLRWVFTNSRLLDTTA
jgi:hypothetical protein